MEIDLFLPPHTGQESHQLSVIQCVAQGHLSDADACSSGILALAH